jgi:hypothetical protein
MQTLAVMFLDKMTNTEPQREHGDLLHESELKGLGKELGQTCEVCGYPFADEHHIVPRRDGGTDNPENLAWVCPNHHSAIHFLMHMEILIRREGRSPSDGQRRLARLKWLLWRDADLYHFYQDRIVPILGMALMEVGCGE